MRMNYGNKTMIMLHVTRTVFPRSRTRTTARYAETGYSSRPCRTDESIAERCRFVSLTASLTPLTQWPQSRCVVVGRLETASETFRGSWGGGLIAAVSHAEWRPPGSLRCEFRQLSPRWKMTTIWHEAGAPSPISCVCVCVLVGCLLFYRQTDAFDCCWIAVTTRHRSTNDRCWTTARQRSIDQPLCPPVLPFTTSTGHSLKDQSGKYYSSQFNEENVQGSKRPVHFICKANV